MFGFFKKKEKKKKKRPSAIGLTESLIVSMVADGMTYGEIRNAFPDLNETTLKTIIKRALARVGMFLDD